MSPRYVAARDHSRPRSPVTWRTVPGECRHTCPAGNPCTCTAQRYARQPGKEEK